MLYRGQDALTFTPQVGDEWVTEQHHNEFNDGWIQFTYAEVKQHIKLDVAGYIYRRRVPHRPTELEHFI